MTEGAVEIRVTILGSGTCVPSLKRSSCSVLVQTGNSNLLFDAGPGTMHRLLEAGLEIFDISFIFFSHFHPDHTGELATFLFSTKYPDTARRNHPLTLVAGNGFSDFFHHLTSVYGRWIELEQGLLHIVEQDNSTIQSRVFGNFTVTSGPVRHNPESTAFRITGPGGRSVVYSGDTDLCDSLVSLAEGADILICESALPDEKKTAGHLTPSEAGMIATRASVGKLVLTHFYPECDNVDMAAQCRKTWSGPLALAEDLMTITVDA